MASTIVPVKSSTTVIFGPSSVGPGAMQSTSVDVAAKEGAQLEVDMIRTAAGTLTGAPEFRIGNVDTGTSWWSEPIIFTTSFHNVAAVGSTLVTAVAAAAAALTLTSTTGITQADRYIGVYNSATITSSEIVHPLSITSPTITLQRGVVNDHPATTTLVFDAAERINISFIDLSTFNTLGFTVDNAVNSVAVGVVVQARAIFLNNHTVG